LSSWSRAGLSPLVGLKLDRLGRSLVGLYSQLAHATKHGWLVVALDRKIDSTTYTGRMFLHLLAALAVWEPDRLAERTSEGMAYAREKYGHLAGRRRGTPEVLAARIVRERMCGETLAAIADGLNSDGYATTRGKDWRPGTVHIMHAQEGALTLRAMDQS
jgi:DNA invertase Pin-like site-specific DNA recombinase